MTGPATHDSSVSPLWTNPSIDDFTCCPKFCKLLVERVNLSASIVLKIGRLEEMKWLYACSTLMSSPTFLVMLVCFVKASKALEQCGRNVSNAFCPSPGQYCCSSHGYCGNTSYYCGNECQSQCDNKPAPAPTAQCGRNESNTLCPLPGQYCCSSYRFCGNTSDYCGNGCQSQCDNKPAASRRRWILAVEIVGPFLFVAGWILIYKCQICGPDDANMQENFIPVHDWSPKFPELTNNPNLTVIFFHGITTGKNNEWEETWTSTTMKREPGRWPTLVRVCWPEKWLPEDMGNNIRILSLSYDAGITSVHNDVQGIGNNLVQSLVTNSRYEELWKAPIVLVGYSFGGLVLKSVVVELCKVANLTTELSAWEKKRKESCESFLQNLKGVVFYSVPHSGAEHNFWKFFEWQYGRIYKVNKRIIAESKLLKSFESFNQQMENLSNY